MEISTSAVSRVAMMISSTESACCKAVSVRISTGTPSRNSISLSTPPMRVELPAAATSAVQYGRLTSLIF